MDRRNTIKKQATECSPERSIPSRERPHKPRGVPNRAPNIPPSPLSSPPEKAAVVYYISRNQKLEHPHFLEVPLSSSGELLLRDVTERLDALRGKGMASLYSWSSKRSYKNGYVWHDLSENDPIVPTHSNEYILKGSELFNDSDADSPLNKPAKLKPSSSSIDCSSSSSSINGRDSKPSAADTLTNVATQTEEHKSNASSSADTLENLIRSNIKNMNSFRIFEEEEETPIPTKARIKATNLIMQLISCGSIPIRNRHSFNVIPSYKPTFSHSKFPSPLSSTSANEFDCFTNSMRFPHERNSNYKPEGRRISAKKTDSFREESVIKIEERLASGARVIIESKSPIEVESCSP